MALVIQSAVPADVDTITDSYVASWNAGFAGLFPSREVTPDDRWRYRSKTVIFHNFAPLRDGWDHGLFTVEAARATYPGAATA
jgi:hypothetical protein